jgi:hypothetical protein
MSFCLILLHILLHIVLLLCAAACHLTAMPAIAPIAYYCTHCIPLHTIALQTLIGRKRPPCGIPTRVLDQPGGPPPPPLASMTSSPLVGGLSPQGSRYIYIYKECYCAVDQYV